MVWGCVAGLLLFVFGVALGCVWGAVGMLARAGANSASPPFHLRKTKQRDILPE